MNSIYNRALWAQLSEAQEPRRSAGSSREFLTGVILPIALGVLATVQTEKTRFWGFLLLVPLAIGMSFYRQIGTAVRTGFLGYQNRRLVAQRHTRLMQLVTHFGELVDPHKSTLEEVVRREICNDSGTTFNQLGITRDRIFHEFWWHLNRRVATKRVSVSLFKASVDEFQGLVNNYVRCCMDPVFEGLPPPIRNRLRPSSRAELEAFRERYLAFRERFEDFARDLPRSIRPNDQDHFYIARPKPLHQPDSMSSSAGS